MAIDNEEIPLLKEEAEQAKAEAASLLKEEAEQAQDKPKPAALLKEEAEQAKTKAVIHNGEAEQDKTKAVVLPKGEAEQCKPKAVDRADLHVGWTADGLPLGPIGQGSVVGEPAARAPWGSGLFSCLGQSDEFCSSDLEVYSHEYFEPRSNNADFIYESPTFYPGELDCLDHSSIGDCLLGTFAPCVLYGSNAERLAGSGTFVNHCLPYTALFLIGNSLFGSNYLAPWLSYTSRTAIRQRETGSLFVDHVGVMQGLLKMKSKERIVNLHAILQLISSAMYVHFAKKDESYVAGSLILHSVAGLFVLEPFVIYPSMVKLAHVVG
ncbi:hypothetical protein ACLOJK_001508 [Asimina triloba]